MRNHHFNRDKIYKWPIFHSYVSLLEGKNLYCSTCLDKPRIGADGRRDRHPSGKWSWHPPQSNPTKPASKLAWLGSWGAFKSCQAMPMGINVVNINNKSEIRDNVYYPFVHDWEKCILGFRLGHLIMILDENGTTRTTKIYPPRNCLARRANTRRENAVSTCDWLVGFNQLSTK